MVEYISNNNDILGNNIIKQQEALGVNRKNSGKNIYKKSGDILDQSDISNEAKNLYEKEQEIQKYKKMVLDSIQEGSSTSDIVNLLNSRKYLDDNNLAESLSSNNDFMNMLLSKEQSA